MIYQKQKNVQKSKEKTLFIDRFSNVFFLLRSNSNEQPSTKKCKIEKKKKIKEEKILHPLLPTINSSPSENKNPNELIEQKQPSYSEIIQEANKLLASDEPPLTPVNNPPTLINPTTNRLTKPIATVSPLHTSKNNQNRVVEEKIDDHDQLIDLSKTNVISYVIKIF